MREFCPDCGAELQVIEHDGFEYRRCPWAFGMRWWERATGLLVACDWPFRRDLIRSPV